jgi:hypothetical protein
VGKPNERERDILFNFRKVQYNNKIIFPDKRNHLQHPNSPTKICLVFRAKSVLLYDPPRKCSTSKIVQTTCYTDCSVRSSNSKNAPPKLCQDPPRFSCAFLLLYRLYGSVQYDLQRQKNNSATKQKIFPWDLCPSKCVLFAAHFPLSSLLRNLSQSPHDVSCTLPNAFFYKSENDIFPPKCLFTFPNPKSKGQD